MTTTTYISEVSSPKRYEKRREAFVHAAAAVFAEKGFHGASTQDIANRLGINQAALYYYFPSKEAALEAVCYYGISHAVERIRQVVTGDLPLRETLPRIFFSQIAGWQMHCDHLTVYQQERHLLSGERRERIREESRNYERLILGLLRNAKRRGEISPEVDVQLANRALVSLGSSVIGLYRRGEIHDIEYIARQFSRLFYSGIRPQPPAGKSAPVEVSQPHRRSHSRRQSPRS
ncbi:MAG: TetR/AcrR family transcriptional regulator [Steroidobacteraceae bacterium]